MIASKHTATFHDGEHKAQRERWAEEKRLIFRVLAPAAYAIVATDGPVSITLWNADGTMRDAIGGNRGVWPAEVARTTSYEDTVSRNYDKFPLLDYRAQLRLWAPTMRERDFLAEDAVLILKRRAEEDGALHELKRRAKDIGTAIHFQDLEGQLAARARALGVVAWSDEGLSQFLDLVLADVAAARAKRAGVKALELIDQAAAQRIARIKGEWGL